MEDADITADGYLKVDLTDGTSVISTRKVVGPSAYEIYVEQFLQKFPGGTPATEKEWLQSTLALGSSLLLKLPTLSDPAPLNPQEWHLGVIDIPLPADTKLTAASTIIASFFDGEGIYDTSTQTAPEYAGYWATGISSYGPLIINNPGRPADTTNSSSTDTTSGHAISYGGEPASVGSGVVDYEKIDQLQEYALLVDGVIMQPGSWTTEGMLRDLTPDLTQRPVLRIRWNSLLGHRALNHNPQILLTGFTSSGIIAGLSDLDGSITTDNPENGDFIGPSVYPWAAKVVFTLPSAYTALFQPVLTLKDLDHSVQVPGDRTASAYEMRIGHYSYQFLYVPSLTHASGSGGTLGLNSNGTITWPLLLEAEANDKSIDPTVNASGDPLYQAGTGITISNPTASNVRTIANSITDLDDLTDVDISSPTNNQVLKYDNTSSKWVNGNLPASNVSYDNSDSGLDSTNVKDAIDELLEIAQEGGEPTPAKAKMLTPGTDFTFGTNEDGYFNGFGLFQANTYPLVPAVDQTPKVMYSRVPGSKVVTIQIYFASGTGDINRLGNQNLMPTDRYSLTGDYHYFKFAHNADHTVSGSDWEHSVIAGFTFTDSGLMAITGATTAAAAKAIWARAKLDATPIPMMWKCK